ncbi:putative E3 ubiquitin-protein [Cricetulus griseus]|nr:putative E3 ubiquitin-protein [Cricetulus griseus]
MTTARYRPTWDLALDPLVSCKLCLGEYPAEQMTTIAQCQCIFCTLAYLARPVVKIECMVAAEIMQRYKKLQFERAMFRSNGYANSFKRPNGVQGSSKIWYSCRYHCQALNLDSSYSDSLPLEGLGGSALE